MSKATTTIGKAAPDSRGYMTKKAARASIRASLRGLGLTCEIMTREGLTYTALITDTTVSVSGSREAGAPITVSCSKGQLSKLSKAAVQQAEGKAQEREAAKQAKPAKAKPAKESEDSPLEVFAALGMDQQGEILSRHPKNGGLSAGAIRFMLEADGVEVPKRLKKTAMVDLLLTTVGPQEAPSTKKGQVLTLESVSRDLEVRF